MRRSLAFLSAASVWFGVTSATCAQTCKCMPGDACYPSTEQWETFSQNLSHPLITGQRPMGAVCYPTDPSYDTSQCETLIALQDDELFLADRINALHESNNDGIINATTLEICPYTPLTNDSTCYQGRVPPTAVNVTTVEDIQAAVRFATEHNLRLVVKNTGHEAMGRPFGVGALELFTFNLKEASLNESWIPEGAPADTPIEHVITIQSGVSWGQAYAAANAGGRFLVGGLSPQGSVGAGGGWQLGGGHSIISPNHGLGVDNSLQFKVVLPNATFVTVNRFTTPDLFWAIRGGGGPSFGIVVETTFRTFEERHWTGAFFVAAATSTESFAQLLEVWMKHHNSISDGGWGGVWPFVSNTFAFTGATPGSPPEHANANSSMQAFFDEAKTLANVTVVTATSHIYDSFYQFFYENLVDSTLGVGFNFTATVPGQTIGATASWLLPREVTAPENAASLAKIMANTTALSLPFMVGGGVVNQIDPSTSAAAPAWRNTITDMTIVTSAASTVDPRSLMELVHADSAPFRALAPPPYGGQYINEADFLEEEWQISYWGNQYERLRAIKKEIDPNDLLIVRKGVNSEGWDAEIICKTV